MKKIVIVWIFLITILSSNWDYEVKLYEKVLPMVFKHMSINAFVDKKTEEILSNSKKITLVHNCKNADVLIGNSFENLIKDCKDKPIFGTTYRSFKKNLNYFGAFYWRKGRPQIRFRIDIIEKHKLNLPQSLRKYAK
ncbi:hypothetical protein [Poseidonibacter sp.]|uniref:hypothetical protein n=1 Tax=Poseidonibacter sp. TaxID=2321188 RepID=UPI003C7151DA